MQTELKHRQKGHRLLTLYSKDWPQFQHATASRSLVPLRYFSPTAETEVAEQYRKSGATRVQCSDSA